MFSNLESRDTRLSYERDQSCVSKDCVWRVEEKLKESSFISKNEAIQREQLHTWKVDHDTSHQLGSGKSGSWVVYLNNPHGGDPLKAFFKPYRGNLQGRTSGEQSMAAELSAYVVNHALGLKNAAAGVIRTLTLDGKETTGYLHVFKHGRSFEDLNAKETKLSYEKYEESLGTLAVFDFLIGNGDRGMPWIEERTENGPKINDGNFMLISEDGQEKLVPIDHGDAFHYDSSSDPKNREAYYTPIKISETVAHSIIELNENAHTLKPLLHVIEDLNGPDIADEFKDRLGKVYHHLGTADDGSYQVHLKNYT